MEVNQCMHCLGGKPSQVWIALHCEYQLKSDKLYIAEYIESQIGFKYVEHAQIPPKMCMRDTTSLLLSQT